MYYFRGNQLMKLISVISSIGIVVLILGVIFHLQGSSIIGPQTSFMYSNPKWTTYGIQMAVSGIVVITTVIIVKIIKKTNSKNQQI